ncbi:MAG: DMT family transporter [Bacteroidales bacterium]|nr:DMT family transporter [Bacteroidales bacterium]
MSNREHRSTYFFLTLAMIFWGLSFVWYKQALVHFGPISLVFFRLLISLPLIAVVSLSMGRLKKVFKADIPYFLLLAFFEPLAYFLGESFGMLYLSSTVASVIIATIPLFTSLVAFWFLKEKLFLHNYMGMLVSFAGVLFVVFSDRASLAATWKGILLISVAVVSAIGYGMVIKRIAGRYNSLTIVTIQNLIGAIYFLPLVFLFELKKLTAANWSFQMLLPVLYLSVFASTIAYVGFIQGVRKLGISKASIFANFIPVFTAIFAFIILKEKVSFYKIIGIVFVIAGLIMSQAVRKDEHKKPEEIIIDELY